MRRTARKLAKRLAASVLRDTWQTTPIRDACGGTSELRRGPFTISIWAAPLRVLDRIEVLHDGNEVWLPLLARLCLRSAVRYRLSLRAMAEAWPEEYDPEAR